jgi:ADP-ribose pyrophosphatase YjhB (NUDIX family)
MSMDNAVERAGVVVLRDRHLALIERQHLGRRYWVVPGGGIELGESVEDAALREAREELGVGVTLGQLRIRIDHRENDGSIQRQWYFDAAVDDHDIRVSGPELTSGRGSYKAVWVPLGELDADRVLPSAVVRWVLEIEGRWPDEVVIIDERYPGGGAP